MYNLKTSGKYEKKLSLYYKLRLMEHTYKQKMLELTDNNSLFYIYLQKYEKYKSKANKLYETLHLDKEENNQ